MQVLKASENSTSFNIGFSAPCSGSSLPRPALKGLI